MGKEAVTTERLLLSGQKSSHVSCKTLASDPLMAAILVITPKDKSAPFRYFRATYFPRENWFRFFVCLKSRARPTFVGVYHDGEFSSDQNVADFEKEVADWICSGGLPEVVKIILGVYDSHMKALPQNA